MRTKRAGSSCDIVSMVERRASAGRTTPRLHTQAALLALALLALAEGHTVKPTAPVWVLASVD